MRTFLVFVLAALLSSPALAQTSSPRFDAAATKKAVAAAASAPASPSPMSSTERVITGAVIGGAAGMLAGWGLWNLTRDCGTCGPGPASALANMGAIGAGIGALIGLSARPSHRHPVIPINRHASVEPAASPSRVSAAVTIAF